MLKSFALTTSLASALAFAQAPTPTTAPPAPNPASAPGGQQAEDVGAIFRVNVVSRTATAVNYRHRGGSTKIDFRGTALMPAGKGEATVESEKGVIRISASFKNLVSPQTFGPEYLTYVLWAISPDGRPVNLGELTLSEWGMGSESSIKTTSEIQTFGMIVTAEPYYAVTQPSDVVVIENQTRRDTMGVVESIDAKYELLPRGVYTMQGKAPGFVAVNVGKKLARELLEAENAVQIARVAGADKYASDSFQKADAALQQAERYQVQKAGQKPVITMAREAVVRAEDSRVIALRREEAERQEQERQASIAREDAARAQADAEAAAAARSKAEAESQAQLRAQADAQRAQADAQRAQADIDRLAAEKAKSEAQAATQEAQQQRQAAEQAKAEADAARAQLAQQAEQSRLAATEADRLRMKAEQDQVQLRQQLLDQFNQILQTRDTARGLIINMSDVLFATARYDLKPGTREKLARLAGIILSHPGLKLQIEGYTDNVGSDEYNMRLSEKRAASVRDFLVTQGMNPANVTAQGFGKTNFVAENTTSTGRQQNRRVEMVVSGDVIGTNINAVRTQGQSETAPAQPAMPAQPATPTQP